LHHTVVLASHSPLFACTGACPLAKAAIIPGDRAVPTRCFESYSIWDAASVCANVRMRPVGPDDWSHVRRLRGLARTRRSPSSENAGASLEGQVSFLEPPSGESSLAAGVRAGRHSKRNQIRAWRRNTSGRRVVRSDQNSTLGRVDGLRQIESGGFPR